MTYTPPPTPDWVVKGIAERANYNALPWREQLRTRPPEGWGPRINIVIEPLFLLIKIAAVGAVILGVLMVVWPTLLSWLLYLLVVVIAVAGGAAVLWFAVGRPWWRSH